VDLLKPYKGGTDALWWLHSLNNIDKHRMLVAAAGSATGVDLGLDQMMLKGIEQSTTMPEHVRAGMIAMVKKSAETPLFHRLAKPMIPLRAGEVFFIDSAGAPFNPSVRLQVHLAVHEPAVVPPLPIMDLIAVVGKSVSTALTTLSQHIRTEEQ